MFLCLLIKPVEKHGNFPTGSSHFAILSIQPQQHPSLRWLALKISCFTAVPDKTCNLREKPSWNSPAGTNAGT